MKRILAILCFAAVLMAGCGSTDIVEKDTPKTDKAESLVEPLDAAADYNGLSHEKNGYGQGVLLDDNNRPTGAVDFNNQYGMYNAKAINDEDCKTIQLTFDQGYENGYTAKILDTLKEKNVKATFFVLQDYIDKNPQLIKRMIDEGHTIGNHSNHHYSMPTLTEEECSDEIMSAHDYMLENYNYEMTEFRPPMGEYSEFSLAVTKDLGYSTVLWSYAYMDWDVDNQPDCTTAKAKLVNAAHDGAIYLLHSVSKTNAEVLGEVIDGIRANGYEFS